MPMLLLPGDTVGHFPPQLLDADGSSSSQSSEPDDTVISPVERVHRQVTDLFCVPSQTAEQSENGPTTQSQSNKEIVIA
jgi:hypothetical protein